MYCSLIGTLTLSLEILFFTLPPYMTPEALEMVYATAIARSYNIAVTCFFFSKSKWICQLTEVWRQITLTIAKININDT